MNKFILSFILSILFFTSSFAQFEAENLFGGANVGYAKPIGDFSDFAKGGFSYDVLVGYKLTENLGVGIAYQGVITGAVDSTASSGLFGVNLYGLESYLAKGWYSFTDGNVKPYASLGLGLARVAEPDITIGNETVKGARRVGFASSIELGVLFKGFNVAYSFNMGGRSPKEPIFNGAASDQAVNYHRFALGYIYNF